MLKETEHHDNCTVIILEDTETGEINIAWYDNDNPPDIITETEVTS